MHLFGKEIRTFSSRTTNRPPQKAEASPLGYRLPSRKYVIPVPLARLELLKIHLMGCLWGAVSSVDTFLKCLNQVMGFSRTCMVSYLLSWSRPIALLWWGWLYSSISIWFTTDPPFDVFSQGRSPNLEVCIHLWEYDLPHWHPQLLLVLTT
jgi:hypothetical protein